jgi:bifunctional non-homologous end joining protein LigD
MRTNRGFSIHRRGGALKPMKCFSVKRLPAGAKWTYEIKLDGFRVVAVRSRGSLKRDSLRALGGRNDHLWKFQ